MVLYRGGVQRDVVLYRGDVQRDVVLYRGCTEGYGSI